MIAAVKIILAVIFLGTIAVILALLVLMPFFVQELKKQEYEAEQRKAERIEQLRRNKADNEERIRQNFERKEKK